MLLHPKGLGNCSSTQLFSELLPQPVNSSYLFQTGSFQIILHASDRAIFLRCFLKYVSLYKSHWLAIQHLQHKVQDLYTEHKALHNTGAIFLASSFVPQSLLHKHKGTSYSLNTPNALLFHNSVPLYVQVSLPGMSTFLFMIWWISIQYFKIQLKYHFSQLHFSFQTPLLFYLSHCIRITSLQVCLFY